VHCIFSPQNAPMCVWRTVRDLPGPVVGGNRNSVPPNPLPTSWIKGKDKRCSICWRGVGGAQPHNWLRTTFPVVAENFGLGGRTDLNHAYMTTIPQRTDLQAGRQTDRQTDGLPWQYRALHSIER